MNHCNETAPVTPRLPRLWTLVLPLALGVAGCGADDALPPGIMERETFVEVYVALRKQALGSPEAELPEEERLRILGEHDVTVEDLVTFAEAHGRDPDYMVEVWREIEGRLNVPVDSTATDSN